MINGNDFDVDFMFNLESLINKKITHKFRLSFDNLIFRFDVWVTDFDNIFAVSFLFSVGKTELSGNLFDFITNFECFSHDANQTSAFSRDNQT